MLGIITTLVVVMVSLGACSKAATPKSQESTSLDKPSSGTYTCTDSGVTETLTFNGSSVINSVKEDTIDPPSKASYVLTDSAGNVTNDPILASNMVIKSGQLSIFRGKTTAGFSYDRSLDLIIFEPPVDYELNGITLKFWNTTTAAWRPMNSITTDDLYGIWGSSATDVYAVGYLTVYAYGEQSTGDVIPHYNGSHWEMSGSGSILYRCIWGSSAADVYVVGKQDGTNCGEWSHFVGSSSSIQDWNDVGFNGSVSKIRSGPLMGVWASSATDVFAVGDEGTILHYSLHY